MTPTAVTCSVKACNHKKFIQDNNISVKFKNIILNKQKFRPKMYIMYQSIPSLTIPAPFPRAILGDSHILVAPGVGFSHLCLALGSAGGRS